MVSVRSSALSSRVDTVGVGGVDGVEVVLGVDEAAVVEDGDDVERDGSGV